MNAIISLKLFLQLNYLFIALIQALGDRAQYVAIPMQNVFILVGLLLVLYDFLSFSLDL